MKLLIISHTPHYHTNRHLVAWGATVRELDHLARLFDQVVHIAPLYPEPDPGSSLPYQADNIRVHPVRPAGGDTLRDKISVLQRLPEYIKAFNDEVKTVDAVHVRCPASISLLALVWLALRRQPKYRWVKFAGNWNPAGQSPISYTLQRWLIAKNLFRGAATINGKWASQANHIRTFVNPCLTDEEAKKAAGIADKKQLIKPCQLLYVGRLETAKGVGRILNIAAELKRNQIDFELNLIGDGDERVQFENEARKLDIAESTFFRGWLPRTSLDKYYSSAHFFLLPSASEGWPKVISEAMAFGAVPLASNVSSIPQLLNETRAGLTFSAEDTSGFAREITAMVQDPARWQAYSLNAVEAASLFTYSKYLERVKALFKDFWGLEFFGE